MTIALIVAIALILVCYQLYILPQRYLVSKARSPVTAADEWIPFRPNWVWVYSGFYYPFLLSPILAMSSLGQFFGVCASYVVMLIAQMIIAWAYPVKTPDDWRRYDQSTSLSSRFLGFVQRIDKGGNCFPSMHVAVAVLTAFHITHTVDAGLYPLIYVVWIIPVLVALSALYTKQHLIVDIPAGAILALLICVGYSQFA